MMLRPCPEGSQTICRRSVLVTKHTNERKTSTECFRQVSGHRFPSDQLWCFLKSNTHLYVCQLSTDDNKKLRLIIWKWEKTLALSSTCSVCWAVTCCLISTISWLSKGKKCNRIKKMKWPMLKLSWGESLSIGHFKMKLTAWVLVPWFVALFKAYFLL